MEDSLFVEEEIGSISVVTVEEEVNSLNYIQQAIKMVNEPLQDDVVYNGILTDIDTTFINGNPVLRYIYIVNQYEVSDVYFFSTKSTMYSVKRLSENLAKFGFELKVETAFNGLESIVAYTKHLIGSEVKIIQNTRNDGNKDYFNYEIVEVTKKSIEN